MLVSVESVTMPLLFGVCFRWGRICGGDHCDTAARLAVCMLVGYETDQTLETTVTSLAYLQ
jgi:hypothetical protein